MEMMTRVFLLRVCWMEWRRMERSMMCKAVVYCVVSLVAVRYDGSQGDIQMMTEER